MFIIWQKGNTFLGWLYAVIAGIATFGLLQELIRGNSSDFAYGFIGVGFFALLSWYCFRPVPKGQWYETEDGRKIFVEEKKSD